MFKVKAKFIGKDSLGFVNGVTYEIILINQPYIGNGRIEILSNNNPFDYKSKKLGCEYNSWETFIPNWEILNYENMTGDYDAEFNYTKVNNGLKQSVRDYKISKIIN